MLRLMAVLSITLAAPAFASSNGSPTSGQGKRCSDSDRCGAGLACITSGDGKATCQIPCTPKTKCPEDQRCVKDNGHSICRPINDSDL